MAKKELTPEMRVMLAFGLSLLILLVSRPLLVRETPPETPDATSPAQPAAPAEQTATAPPATPQNTLDTASAAKPSDKAKQAEAAAQEAPAVPAGTKQGEREEQITVNGDLYRVVFSTRGGAVKSWVLKNFKDKAGLALELVNEEAARKYGDPLGVWIADATLRQQAGSALFLASAHGELQAPVTLSFEYSSGRLGVRKQFTFARDSFVVGVESDVSVDGQPQVHQLAWPGSFGDSHDAMAGGVQASVVYQENEKLVLVTPGDVEGEERTASGPFPFAGIQDHFFTAAFLPAQGSLRVSAFKSEVSIPDRDAPAPAVGVGVGSGDGPSNRLRLFVGPKDPRILPTVDPRLAELIDYGWFAFVAKPLYLGLRWIHDHIVGNYGWAIILLTVVINFAMIPLKLSSLRSARKMQMIAPQVRAIQEKYKNLKLKDPKRQQMSQETMALYQKHGVNPVGGCLPMLIQIPFLYGFYKVLVISIEMRQAPWIAWFTDLSAPEDLPIRVLPLLMCGSQFILQRMTPTPAADPMQQKIMLFMPVMFVVFFWSLSSGLVLYWTTGNLVGIAQQWYFNRTELKHEVEAKQAGKKKRGAQK